jgi:hypothetical protein
MTKLETPFSGISVASHRTGVKDLDDYLKPAAPDNFLAHLAPFSVGAVYFGAFVASHQDGPATRQALYKTSFVYRHFLQPAGIRVRMEGPTAVLFGECAQSALWFMAENLALQIDGVVGVKFDTFSQRQEIPGDRELLARVRLLLATDTLLGSQKLEAIARDGHVEVFGTVHSEAAGSWAQDLFSQLLGAKSVQVRLVLDTTHSKVAPSSTSMDDDSVQALVLTRARVLQAGNRFPVRVKSRRQRIQVSAKARNQFDLELIERLASFTLGVKQYKGQIVLGS